MIRRPFVHTFEIMNMMCLKIRVCLIGWKESKGIEKK